LGEGTSSIDIGVDVSSDDGQQGDRQLIVGAVVRTAGSIQQSDPIRDFEVEYVPAVSFSVCLASLRPCASTI
jgi:hypothetical protein